VFADEMLLLHPIFRQKTAIFIDCHEIQQVIASYARKYFDAFNTSQGL